MYYTIGNTGSRCERLWLTQIAGMQFHTETCQRAGGRRSVVTHQRRHLMAKADCLAYDRLPDKARTACNE